MQILKSLHRFSLNLVIILFSSIIGPAYAEKDYLLFKIQDKIFSLNEIIDYPQNLKKISCLFPDSVWVQYVNTNKKIGSFTGEIKIADKDAYKKIIQDNLDLIISVRQFLKLHLFIENQDVVVDKSLIGLLKNETKCGKILNGEKVIYDLNLILLTEIYIRSRYFQSDKSMKMTAAKERSISLLLDSTDRQINHENFW